MRPSSERRRASPTRSSAAAMSAGDMGSSPFGRWGGIRTVVLFTIQTNGRATFFPPMSTIDDATTPVADAEDGRKARGDRTRRAILTSAVNVASVEGLEGLSIGRLATELEMSKSGLFAHFGSKEELQISTVRAAAAIFAHRVILPAEEQFEPGIAR